MAGVVIALTLGGDDNSSTASEDRTVTDGDRNDDPLDDAPAEQPQPETVERRADPVTTPETAATTTAATPTTASVPTVDQSGYPIVDGWFILESSGRKGQVDVSSLERVASNVGGYVVDTDSYSTGYTSDGRAGSRSDEAAKAPGYWPGGDALAAVSGPYPDLAAAEAACEARGDTFTECIRQFRPLPGEA